MRGLRGRSTIEAEVSSPRSLSGIISLAGLTMGEDSVAQSAAGDQLRSFARLLPGLMLAHALLAMPLLAFAGAGRDFAASGLIGAALVIDMAIWWAARHGTKKPDSSSSGVVRIIAATSFISGALWTMIAVWALDRVTMAPAALIAALVMASLVAALIYALLPAALFAHISSAAIAVIALHLDPLLAVTVIAGLFATTFCALVTARDWRESIRGQGRVDMMARQARDLLADFERSGKGWFWETDASGRITYVSASIAQLASAGGDPIGRAITGVFETDEERISVAGKAPGERSIGFHLSAQMAFDDIVVRPARSTEDRWWSISGRPVRDSHGRFLGFRGNGTDLTEMRRSEAEVAKLARSDSLTGLPNRMVMKQTLEAAVRDALLHRRPCALFLLDLDRFKVVNDTLGHPVGDALLRQVAERLAGVVGKAGRVGRLGGDEFMVVVPHFLDRNYLAHLADSIIARVSMPYVIEGSQLSIGTSLGIALCPDDGTSADAITRNADLALYAAKAGGKGISCFYESKMHAEAEDRRLIEIDLRNALGEDGLHLAFQPLVNAASEGVVGFEALCRWRHPVRGMVSPADFIPIAEEIGLIPRIGEWVIRTACAEAAKWPPHVRVAVNISPLQFANPALPAIITSALAEAQLAPQRLELEITEGVFMQDDAETTEMFARLKRIGVRFALDDFGTGYSSLGYLQQAPFDKIKIDQSFVRGAVLEGSRNAAIIRAIVTLAESLGMETVAEGVETHDDLALIRSLGCSTVQGYIFGKPMGPEEALAHVTGGSTMMPVGFPKQRATRIAVLRKATLMIDGRKCPARLRNISEYGAMIEVDNAVPDDARIELVLADGERLAARVRWYHEGRLGMRFDRAFNLDKIRIGNGTLAA